MYKALLVLTSVETFNNNCTYLLTQVDTSK